MARLLFNSISGPGNHFRGIYLIISAKCAELGGLQRKPFGLQCKPTNVRPTFWQTFFLNDIMRLAHSFSLLVLI